MLKKEVVSNTTEKVLDDSICKIVYEAYRILAKNVKQNKPLKRKKDNKLTYFSTNDTPIAAQDAINALNNSYKGTMVNMSESDYKRIRYKSIYVSWKPLVDFSWSIIKGKKIGMKESDTQSECVFVDMAEIWEAFLRKKLSEGMSDEGWRVWTVYECKREVYKDSFFKRHIIPDIVLHRISKIDGKDEFLVFDAKYKRMVGEKEDVDRSDFFQIHTYMHYFQHVYPNSRVLLGGLLYPWDTDELRNSTHNLFGENGSFNTKFIVDGIVCTNLKTDDNQKTKDEMQARVQEMITRIKSQIN
jgi:5-methylcytosine-specific restriction endonuclease McrBC regulatory subunit McrC